MNAILGDNMGLAPNSVSAVSQGPRNSSVVERYGAGPLMAMVHRTLSLNCLRSQSKLDASFVVSYASRLTLSRA